MDFGSVMDAVGKLVDAVGVAAILVGVMKALAIYLVDSKAGTRSYPVLRQSIGRSILLGLEFLVAGDIIRTVAASPTFESIGVLVLIVFIRTFLSFTLEVELSGRWPWQRTPTSGDSDSKRDRRSFAAKPTTRRYRRRLKSVLVANGASRAASEHAE